MKSNNIKDKNKLNGIKKNTKPEIKFKDHVPDYLNKDKKRNPLLQQNA